MIAVLVGLFCLVGLGVVGLLVRACCGAAGWSRQGRGGSDEVVE